MTRVLHPARVTMVVVLLVGTFVLTREMAAARVERPPVLDRVPMTLAGWRGTTAPPLDAVTAQALGADRYLHRFYRGPRHVVELDVAYYARPRVGANMHSPLNCLPGNGWAIRDLQTTAVAGGAWRVRTMLVERAGKRFAIAYWFQGRNRVASDELSTRLLLLADAFARRPADEGLIRLMTPVTGDAADEHATLATFAASVIPAIAAELPAS